MLENFFLEYANQSLQEKPERILKILSAAKPHIDPEQFELLEETANRVVHFADRETAESAKEIFEKSTPGDESYQPGSGLAYEAVFGHTLWKCKTCYPPDEISRKEFFEKAHIKFMVEPCYVCDQQLFRCILAEITQGTEFSEIPFLRILLLSAPWSMKKWFQINPAPTGSAFQEALRESTGWEVNINFIADKTEFGGAGFNGAILDMAAFSLLQFLTRNDRRKLKACPFCHNFFVAEDIRRQRCYSDECRKAYETDKKRKQRIKNPVKYC